MLPAIRTFSLAESKIVFLSRESSARRAVRELVEFVFLGYVRRLRLHELIADMERFF